MAKIKSGFTGERAVVLPAPIISEYKTSELGQLLHITDIGIYPNASFHFRGRNESESNQYVLIYCSEGEGWYTINHQTYKVAANQLFVLPKNKAHTYGSQSKNAWTIYWIHFDGSSAQYLTEGLEKPFYILPEKDSRIEERFKLFEEILATLRNGYSRSNLDYSTTALFHFLGSIKFLNSYRSSARWMQQQKDVAEEAIHYMRENIHKRLTLKEISTYLGISPSHFSAVFQKKTGYSPLNYLSHLKIQEACHYLDFSDMKITQISIHIGFDDPFYFSRLFSKVMGVSPSEYRNRKKG